MQRYARHIVLPEIGLTGQRALSESKVLVIGAGGLGAPLIAYLAASGIGTLGIVDFDQVELSNLQRQILYKTTDVGRKKAGRAAHWVQAFNPELKIDVHDLRLDHTNALEIIQEYDVIADGSDNFATRYLVNDACVLAEKPLVYGSIFRFEGQVSVFNLPSDDGERGPNYRDLFPNPPSPDMVPNCAEGGVLGVLPGIVGSIQASEVIKIICRIGETLSGKLLLIDVLRQDYRTLKILKNKANPFNLNPPGITQLSDYAVYCQTNLNTEQMVKSINVHQLKAMQDNGEEFQLLDVREPWEYELTNLNGLLIPKGEIEHHLDQIARDKKVVVQCRSGVRSADVIILLQKKYGLQNLYNLEGGILAWAKEIDQSKPQY